MNLSYKIAWNTIVQILGKFSSTLLGLVIVGLLTRYLSLTDYGLYTFIFVFVMMFGSIADWGLTLITVREASRNEQKAEQIISNTLFIRLILAVIASLIAIFTIHFFSKDPLVWSLVTVASLLLIAQSLKTSFQIIFQVKLQMQYWAICEFVANLVIVTTLFIVVFLHGGLLWIIVSTLLGNFVAAIAAAALSYRLLPLKPSFDTKEAKYLLMEALPMGSLLVLFTIYNRIDTVILANFQGSEPVAIYGISYKVYEVLVLGAAYFSNSILPLISNLAKTDKNKMGEVYLKSFILLFWFGLVVSLGNLLLAPFMINVIAGKDYLAAVLPLRILSLALVVSYFNHLNGYTLIALGKQWYSFFIAILALGINVVLNFWLIPHYSYNAAAFNTFLTEGLIVIISLIVIYKETGQFPHLIDLWTVSKEFVVKKGKVF